MTDNRRALVKRTAGRKGFFAAGASAGTVALFIVGAPWFLGAVGLAGSGYLVYDWLRFRGKWGLRF